MEGIDHLRAAQHVGALMAGTYKGTTYADTLRSMRRVRQRPLTLRERLAAGHKYPQRLGGH